MSIREFLLGFLRLYSGGGGGGQTSSTQVVQNYSPEEAARRTQVMDEAQRIYQAQQAAGTWNGMVNPAPRPVGPSDATQQAQQMITNAATGQGTQLANSGFNAAQFGLSGQVLDPSKNPGYDATLQAALRPVNNAMTDPNGVLAQIRQQFNQSSGGTGTREGIAAGIAGREYLNTVGDISGKLALSQYGQGLDFMKSSMAFAPNMYNMLMQPGISVGTVGQQQEGYQQAQEDYAAQGRSWAMNAPWAGLQPYASMVTGMANPSTTSTTMGTMPQGNRALGVLGGAAMGAYIGSVVPGIGTAVGAGAGALLGLFAGS